MGAAKIPKDKVTQEIDRFIRMEANGCTRAEKLHELFGIDDLNDSGVHAADCKMSRWRNHPLYDEIWKDESKKWSYRDHGRALMKLRELLNADDDRWLVMNTAVNLLSKSEKRIYGNEDNSFTVKVEGMPDLGSPDQVEE